MLPFGPDPYWCPDADWYRNTWDRGGPRRRQPVIAPVLLAMLAVFFAAVLHAS